MWRWRFCPPYGKWNTPSDITLFLNQPPSAQYKNINVSMILFIIDSETLSAGSWIVDLYPNSSHIPQSECFMNPLNCFSYWHDLVGPFLSIPDKNEKTKHFKYSSIKSQLDKNATKKRKRASNNKKPVGPPTPTASTSNEQWQTTTPHGNILAGKFGAKQNGNFFRAGSLPAVLSESKPMKDADRLLGVLTEHACVDSYLEEGQVYNLVHAYHFHIISVTKCSI